jgi:hypothetical protein
MLFPGTVQDMTYGDNLLETNSNIFYNVNISCIVIVVEPERYNQQQLLLVYPTFSKDSVA